MKENETSALVIGAVEDAKRLMSLEVKRLKMELFSAGTRIRRVALFGSAAFGIALNAGFILTVASALALHAATDLSVWICCSIVGAALFMAMGACALRAKQIWTLSGKEVDDGTGSRNAGT